MISTATQRARHRAIGTAVAAALVGGLLLGVSPTAAHAQQEATSELPPGGSFVDDDGNRHEGDIEAILAADVTQGCTDDGTRYCPDEPITRGQMAAFLTRTLDLPPAEVDAFGDDDGTLFEAEINALAARGYTEGHHDGTFRPTDLVTRGQLAVLLARAGGLPPSDADHFPDDDAGPFEPRIDAITAAGIVVPCADGSTDEYCPGDPALRDQMASYLARFLGLDPIVPPARPVEEPVDEPDEVEALPAPEPDPADDPYSATVEEAIAHWFDGLVAEATAVARCESRLNPAAINPNGGFYGIFQLGQQWHVDPFARVTGETWDDAVLTPWFNAQYARHLYDGSGWSQWTCQP